MMQTNRGTQLNQSLKPQWAWAIAFGSSVGWGAFVLPTDWLHQSGPLAAAIGFFIGALFMIIIGVSYGYLIKHYPVSGGEFAYTYLGFGRYHAYIAGWFLTLGYISIVALNASALGVLVKFIFPGIAKTGYMYSIAGWDIYAGQVLIIGLALMVFAFLNRRGTNISGRLEFYFCILMMAGIIILVISMFASPETTTANLQPLFKPGTSRLSAVLAIVAIAPWAFVGFDNIPQTAEEFDFSSKKAFKLIVFALLAAAFTYSAMIFSTAVAGPWRQLVQQNSVWGTGDAVNAILGKTGLAILAISLLMGVFTGLNGFYVSASRLLFAMGRANILPAIFAKLHPKYQTPVYSLYFICFVCLIAPFFGRQVLQWIVDMTSVGMSIAYFYCCATVYKQINWRTSDSDNKTSPVTIKVMALAGMMITLGFLGLLVIPGAPGFLSQPSWIILMIWMAFGALFYLFKAKTFHNIPQSRLDYNILGKQHDH